VQTNGEKLQREHKDIKDLEAVDEKEVHVTKQVRLHSYSLTIKISMEKLTFLDLSIFHGHF
jgi:hypothetical protein